MNPLILAFETSCDETAVAVVRGTESLSNVLASQVDLHSRFGGVVPEVAARAHVEAIRALTHQALNEAGIHPADLDGVGATAGPGLVGALLVGHSFAKATAWARQIPFVGVDHMEGHLMAPRLQFEEFDPPMVCLLASGGHSQIVHATEWGEYRTLGTTIDDAAGEAFDKLARVMGLGFPGGPAIDAASEGGDPTAVDFPRALPDRPFDFSFSGLKTSVVTFIEKAQASGDLPSLADVAASVQEAIVDVLVDQDLQRGGRDGGAGRRRWGRGARQPTAPPPLRRGGGQAGSDPGHPRPHPLHRQRRHDRRRRRPLALHRPHHRLGRERRPGTRLGPGHRVLSQAAMKGMTKVEGLAGKSFIVVGGAGFIGSHLVRLLLASDVAKLVVYGGLTGAQANLRPDSRVVLVNGLVEDRDHLQEAMTGVDGVFLLASRWLSDCAKDPIECVGVNVGGGMNTLEACRSLGVSRIVFASSIALYGPARAGSVAEDHPVKPDSVLRGYQSRRRGAVLCLSREYVGSVTCRVASAVSTDQNRRPEAV